MRWEKKNEAMKMGSGPGKRWGHTCNAIKGGKLLYVFGGYGQHNSQTNQVHVFDTESQTWSEPSVKGTPPTPRDSHTCTVVNDNLFVFGGTDGLNPLKDLHILNTGLDTWISPMVIGDGPEAREGHSAAVVGKRLFIFGGCGKSRNNLDEVYYNDLYVLDTGTFVWQRAITTGKPPAARDSHSCSSWRNKIVVIGGEDQHNYYLSDVHILDTDTLVWEELHTSGQLLPPRAGHSAVAFGKYIFVFGGFSDAQNLYDDIYVLDLDTGIWAKILPSGDGPSARFSMSGDCLDPSKGSVLVFTGGCSKTLEALDDMYYLHTELVRDDGRDYRRLEKLSLRKQLKLKCQEQYVENALVAYGTSGGPSLPTHSQQSQQYVHLNMYQPTTGKRAFQARVTKNFANSYTIETVIDGKPLRGVLFSTSSSTKPNPDRKKDGENVESKSNTDKELVTRYPTSHGSHTEVANTSGMKDTGHSDAGPSLEVARKDSQNLTGLNSTSEINKTDGALTTENQVVVPKDPQSLIGLNSTSEINKTDGALTTEKQVVSKDPQNLMGLNSTSEINKTAGSLTTENQPLKSTSEIDKTDEALTTENQVVLKDPQNLMGLNSTSEIDKTDGALTTENQTTIRNPPETAQGSGSLPTNQDDQAGSAERTSS